MSEHRLHEIVIERPRSGARLKMPPGEKRKSQKSGYECKQRESLRRRWKESNHSKHLSDHLGPLRRLLFSKVGQPWDDVYSEICQRLDKNTVIGQHVLSHLWDYVERHVVIINGVPYQKTYRKFCTDQLGYWQDQLYIHPDTGILCLVKKSHKDFSKKIENLVVIDSYHQYRKISGIWYLITLKDLPQKPTEKDILLQVIPTVYQAQQEYGKPIYAASKRQCNKKEIKWITRQLTQT